MSLGSDLDSNHVAAADSAVLGSADELLGAYALVSELASGHLTTLHRGHALGSSGGGLVIKRLQYRFVHEAADRELLLTAGRAAMRVRAPNVVRTIAVHEDPEPFVVLEYVPGVTLSTLLAETEDREVLRYVFPVLVDVLEGLEVLHGFCDTHGTEASLVHGAPSARHILVGDDGVARLFDLTHATGPGFSVTARRNLRLLPSEMAPEQILAPMHVDARCDLFIVGTVLWRALTGQPLFEHVQREEAMQQLLRKPILAPSEAGSLVGKSFDRVCMRALARTRADRYASAAQMARELKTEAERAGLFAPREEIASLVRTLALASDDGEAEREPLISIGTDKLADESASAPSAASTSAKPSAPAGVFGSRVEPRASTANSGAVPSTPTGAFGSRAEARASSDVLSSHHQGSSHFGFERLASEAVPLPAAALQDLAARAAANGDQFGSHAEARASTIESGDESAAQSRAHSRESGTWYEGVPSILPSREEPRSSAPFWLWGSAAAIALLGSVLIDNPPWRHDKAPVAQRLTESHGKDSDVTARPSAAAGYATFFEAPHTSVTNAAALAPREAPAAQAACPPAASEAAEPVVTSQETNTVSTAPVAPRAVRVRERELSPLPPNPY